MPNLMVGLRHIWTMSNYYCYDARMQELLRKISFVFTEKIKELVNLKNIFSRSAAEANELAHNCARLLCTWKKTYMLTRAFIEKSGVGSRWEFDRFVLFNDVDHCARISQDIADVAKIFMEFESMFSFQLKMLVDDPKDIDNMLRKIYKLIAFVVNVDYDIFRSGNLENWEATLEFFHKQVANVELESKLVLDGCINSLRSAREGLGLIKSLGTLQTRPSLAAHMSTKHEYIMKKFISEIGVIEHEFLKYRKTPPRTRNQPEYIGAVLWQRLLFAHLKKSVMEIKSVEDDPALQNSYLKRTAFSQYFTLVHEMTDFERTQFQDYIANGIFIVNTVLNGHIVKLSMCEAPHDRAALRKQRPKAAPLPTPVVALPEKKKSTTSSTSSMEKDKARRRSSGQTGAKSGKFGAVAVAMKWLLERPGAGDENVQKAKKFMDSTVGTKTKKDAVEYMQAKRRSRGVQSYNRHLKCMSTFLLPCSDY